MRSPALMVMLANLTPSASSPTHDGLIALLSFPLSCQQS
jgi:hypothetical protein